MASFTNLPSELLTHILDLSNAGETAQEKQRSRLAFGLIARAFYLATAGSTSFCVAGDAQSRALVAKLDQGKTREARQALTTASGGAVVDVRQLSVAIPNAESEDLLANLLHETPNLVELELRLSWNSLRSPERRALPEALTNLVNLRELRVGSDPSGPTKANGHFSTEGLMRLLLSLPALEVLIMGRGIGSCGPTGVERNPLMRDLYDRLALPRLRNLTMSLDSHEVIAAALTGSTPRVLELDGRTCMANALTSISLLPGIATIVDFTWTFPSSPLFQADRDERLALIGAMRSLERIQIPLWTITGPEFNYDTFWMGDADHLLLHTLATLPLLHTVKLIDQIGPLHDKHVIVFIKALDTLRNLSIVVKDADADGWTQDQLERVCAVAEDAGVAFSYRTERRGQAIERLEVP